VSFLNFNYGCVSGIADKVLHLVGRPPPSLPGAPVDTRNDIPPPSHAHGIHMDGLNMEQLQVCAIIFFRCYISQLAIRNILDEHGETGRTTQIQMRERGPFVDVTLQYR
jgi:hypothetical protein